MTSLGERFGHLSVSHVNEFISRRSRWYLARILKHEFPAGPEAHRGSAVEKGVVAGLMLDVGKEDCIALALHAYDELTPDLDVDDVAKCRAPIPGMVACLLDALIEVRAVHGRVVSAQSKVVCRFDEFPGLDWIGYTDVEFNDGLIVDIKTTGRKPSALSTAWARQGAFYSHCRSGKPVEFHVAVPLKRGIEHHVFPLSGDGAVYLRQLIEGAKTMQALIAMDNQLLAQICAPDPDDWTLNDAMVRHAASRIWPAIIQEKPDAHAA